MTLLLPLMRPFSFALPLLAMLSPLHGQDGPRVECRNCDSKGKFDCKNHGKLLEAEHGVRFCSQATECKLCGGALAIDCKVCRNEAVEQDILKRQQLAREWLAKRRKDVDEITKNFPLMHLETEHIDLVFSIKPLTVGKEKLDTHALMHLYGERMEHLRQQFLELFELDTKQVEARLRLYMFRDQQDQAQIGPRVTEIGMGSAVGIKKMGIDSIYSMWMDPKSIIDDESLYRNMVHNVTHLLLSNMKAEMWLGQHKLGWIDEGLAHWFEDKLTGKCLNYCYEEVMTAPGTTYKGGKWRRPVRLLVDAGKGRNFAELSALNTDQLLLEDHAMAFAYCDFLLSSQPPSKFRDMVRIVKQKKPLRDALQQVYGLNPLTIDAQFQAWVKEHYSLKEQ